MYEQVNVVRHCAHVHCSPDIIHALRVKRQNINLPFGEQVSVASVHAKVTEPVPSKAKSMLVVVSASERSARVGAAAASATARV